MCAEWLSFLVDPGFEPGIRRGAFAYQLRLCHGGLFTGAVLGLDFRADKFAHRIRGSHFIIGGAGIFLG
jgi:hypothetical protein